jgi:ribosomal protein S18 acetylase RimI-like enzyme
MGCSITWENLMIQIREHQPADFDSLKTLFLEMQTHEQQFDSDRDEPTDTLAARYISQVLKDIEDRQGIILVAVDGNTICGFAAGYAEEDLANLHPFFLIAELVVSVTYRGHGIGSDLVRSMENAARDRGFKRAGIGVLVGNDRVHALYKRLGFRDYAVELRKEL